MAQPAVFLSRDCVLEYNNTLHVQPGGGELCPRMHRVKEALKEDSYERMHHRAEQSRV